MALRKAKSKAKVVAKATPKVQALPGTDRRVLKAKVVAESPPKPCPRWFKPVLGMARRGAAGGQRASVCPRWFKPVLGMAAAVLGSSLLIEYVVGPSPIEVAFLEMGIDLTAKSDSPLTFEPAFLKHGTAVFAKSEPFTSAPIAVMRFDTRPPDACRSFRIVYSARDEIEATEADGGGTPTPALKVYPSGSSGAQCRGLLTAGADRRSGTLSPGDSLMVPLNAAPKEPLLWHQRALCVYGTARVLKGGGLLTTTHDAAATVDVRICGEPTLEVQSLQVQPGDSLGELRAVLTSVDGLDVRLNGQNLSWIRRLRVAQLILLALEKLVGG